jgi:23S rRNA (uracil1939-C5)-methyltransferase
LTAMNDFTATVETLAFGGNGVCRNEGKVCFVPFSCPGDQLRLSVTSEKRSYQTARIVDILEPSTSRVTPPCPVFGRCGGCSWQHISYERQMQAKRQILVEALWRAARVEEGVVGPMLPAPMQYWYRSRVQFKLHAVDGRLQVGFFRNNSHRVEDLPDGCMVALPEINTAQRQLRAVLEGFPERGLIPVVHVECGDSGVVAVIHYGGIDAAAAAGFFLDSREVLSSLSGLWLQSGRKSTLSRVWGDERLYYAMPSGSGRTEARLGFAPGGFSQVNREQNRTMLEVVRRMASFQGSERLLDLYCGNGNLSLPLAGEVASVAGIEEYRGSIDKALLNMKANGITNVEFICADALAGLKAMTASGRRFDVVILDPPRSGASDAVPLLPLLKPQRIIYVSCDPSTLARDCGLLQAEGYRVVESVPLDMFPQTYHLESVTLLQKR